MVNKKEKLDSDKLSTCSTLINNNNDNNEKSKKTKFFNKKQRFIYNFKVFTEIQSASLSSNPGYKIDFKKIKNDVKEKYK